MKKITSITDDYNQNHIFTLDDGSSVNFAINYVPSQLGWFYSVIYGQLSFDNMRIVNSPNMLRRFRNVIPFGLACTVVDGYEIVNLSDFVSGRASLYVLNPTDVSETETLITLTLPNFVGYPLN